MNRRQSRPRRYPARPRVIAILLLAGCASPARAQTDFYNTDHGRPLQIEDAIPIGRYAIELQLAPIRIERGSRGTYHWGFDSRLEYGILPRTHLEIGIPFVWRDVAGRTAASLAGVDVVVMHALNAETITLPAIALSAGASLPAGALGPDRAFGTIGVLGTRSMAGAIRVHANANYTFGPAARTGTGARDIGRWLGGVALDKTIAVRSLLFGVETFARLPLSRTEDIEWNSAAGLRYQVDPRWVCDFGAGRRYTGSNPGWFLTLGSSYALAWRALLPQGGR